MKYSLKSIGSWILEHDPSVPSNLKAGLNTENPTWKTLVVWANNAKANGDSVILTIRVNFNKDNRLEFNLNPIQVTSLSTILDDIKVMYNIDDTMFGNYIYKYLIKHNMFEGMSYNKKLKLAQNLQASFKDKISIKTFLLAILDILNAKSVSITIRYKVDNIHETKFTSSN